MNLDEQDSRPAPQATKKKKKGKIIVVDVGLEGFVDWVEPNAMYLTKEREDDMSRLAAGFFVWMCKRVVSAQGETTPTSEVSS